MFRRIISAAAVAIFTLGMLVVPTFAGAPGHDHNGQGQGQGDHSHDHGNGNGGGYGGGYGGCAYVFGCGGGATIYPVGISYPTYVPSYAPSYAPSAAYSSPQATSIVYVVQFTVAPGGTAQWADGFAVGCPNGCYPGEQFSASSGLGLGYGLTSNYGSYGTVLGLGTTLGCLSGGYSVGCGGGYGVGIGLGYVGGGLTWPATGGCGFMYCGGSGGGDGHDGHDHWGH